MATKRNEMKTTSTETQPRTEERVAALKEKLKQGLARIESEADWRKHLTRFGKMGPQSPLRYSFNNQVLLMVQADERAEAEAPIDLSAVATFDGWKQVGRLVRKGEKALWILRPSVCKDWKKINAAKAEGRTMSAEELAKATFVMYGMMRWRCGIAGCPTCKGERGLRFSCSCCGEGFYTLKPQDPVMEPGFGICATCAPRVAKLRAKHEGPMTLEQHKAHLERYA